MKRTSAVLAIVLLTAFCTSCNSAKKDAKKLAKKACECQVMEDSESPDKSVLNACWEEALQLAFEMREKYKDDNDALTVFEKVLDDAEKDCSKK